MYNAPMRHCGRGGTGRRASFRSKRRWRGWASYCWKSRFNHVCLAVERRVDLGEVGAWLLWLVIFAALAAFVTWAGVSGWVDGTWDPFPGVDMLPG